MTDEKETRSRSLNRLSAVKVDTARPGTHADGGGLTLRVDDKGSRKWVLRYTSPVTGKRRDMGLGRAGKGYTSLADARIAAAEARGLVSSGLDPMDVADQGRQARAVEARKAKPKTFGEFSDEWLNANETQFRNLKHRAQWRMTLGKYAAALRDKLPDEITTADVFALLQPIWKMKPETARRTQGRIERILDAAKAAGHRTGDNPARWRGHLDTLLPRRAKDTRGHHAALPYHDLARFMGALRDMGGVGARALEFCILTAARSGEVRGMVWAECNIGAKRWTVPAVRMKAGKEHRVPLADRAVEILDEMAALRPKDDRGTALVFPGAIEGKALSDMTLTATIKRLHNADVKEGGPGFKDPTSDRIVTAHGFRSAFRDWGEDVARAPFGTIKAALAHTIGDKVDAAYRRGDAFDARRELMQVWEQFACGGTGNGNVIRMHGQKGKRRGL